MKSFKADYVIPVNSDPIRNGIVTVDDFGTIISVTDHQQQITDHPVEHLSGVICPGFINTHCHLELSHLKNKVEQGTGLVNFIIKVQKVRKEDAGHLKEAALMAEEEMTANGIVAVGDISNTNTTAEIKKDSKIYYHTFVETFGFLPDRAEEVFNNALNLLSEFKPQSASIAPHAPYSVSKDLFKRIKNHADSNSNLLTIHNQECDDENRFYRYKLGSFNDLYAQFGIDISYFKPQARNSIQSVVPLMTNKQNILMVHNTCTNLKDIYFVKRFDRRISWCFCPNANLYIEKRLPKIELFRGQGYNLTLGTDSLASNDKLCILSEMRTIQHKFPAISTPELIKWGTLNGATYMGIDDTMGSMEPGKRPGLNLITGLDGLNITPESSVRKLI